MVKPFISSHVLKKLSGSDGEVSGTSSSTAVNAALSASNVSSEGATVNMPCRKVTSLCLFVIGAIVHERVPGADTAFAKVFTVRARRPFLRARSRHFVALD